MEDEKLFIVTRRITFVINNLIIKNYKSFLKNIYKLFYGGKWNDKKICL